MPEEFLTMADIGTFGGAVFAVTLISQFLKGALDRVLRLPTRFLVLFLAWAVLIGRHYVVGGLSMSTVYLDLLNGFLVALASMGTHQLAQTHLKWK